MSKKNGSSDEWGTPQWLFNMLNKEFNFELDVCATKQNSKCKRYFNQEEDGLKWPWVDNYFCNPPYSNILPWAIKGVESLDRCHTTGVHLVKYDPSTKHGQVYADHADEIRIPDHRIAFVGAPNTALFPVAIMLFRKRLYTRKSDPRILYCNFRQLISAEAKSND